MKYGYFFKKHFPTPPECEWTNDEYKLFVLGGKVVSDKEYVVCIEKDPTRDFVILNLTDIQLRLCELRKDADCVAIAEKTIKKLVEEVKPDLITVTGDQGFGDKRELLSVGRMIDRFGIPWAPVFGNADNRSDEGISTGAQTFLYENAFRNCLLKAGPTNLARLENGSIRYGNYIVNIVERAGEDFHVVRSLIFVNSGDEQPYPAEDYPGQERANPDDYSKLTSEQIEWYRWAVRGVQSYGKGKKVPSSLFLHIPIYAYNEAYRTAKNPQGGWNSGYEKSYGEVRETFGTPPYDDHVFSAIKEGDSTDLIVCGHDHRNNYIITHKGVTFCYGLKTGKGCYWDQDMSGGTVITIKKDGTKTVYHKFCPVKVIGLPRWIYPLAALVGLAVGLIAGLL